MAHALVEESKAASIAPQPVCLLIPHLLSLEQRFLNVLKNFLLFLPRHRLGWTCLEGLGSCVDLFLSRLRVVSQHRRLSQSLLPP